MTHDPASPMAARQAALTLHALDASDRSWVLAALAPQEREQLHPLLEELKVLGIPADDALARDVAEAGIPSGKARDWLGDMDEGEGAALASVLREEPLELQRVVLAMLGEPARRHAIAALGKGPGGEQTRPVAPALERAVRAALAPRWKARLAAAASAARAPAWKLAGARIARLVRLP